MPEMKEVMPVEVTVKGTPKEIAGLVLEIQVRQQKAMKPEWMTDGKSIMASVEMAQRQASRIFDIPSRDEKRKVRERER